jgi:hypothetical protein
MHLLKFELLSLRSESGIEALETAWDRGTMLAYCYSSRRSTG